MTVVEVRCVRCRTETRGTPEEAVAVFLVHECEPVAVVEYVDDLTGCISGAARGHVEEVVARRRS